MGAEFKGVRVVWSNEEQSGGLPEEGVVLRIEQDVVPLLRNAMRLLGSDTQKMHAFSLFGTDIKIPVIPERENQTPEEFIQMLRRIFAASLKTVKRPNESVVSSSSK